MGVSIQGLFETHLTVRNLATSVAFYRDTVGLELAYLLDEPRVAFFWIGGRGQAMLGVWEVGYAPNVMSLHLAFTSTVEQVLAAPSALKAVGVVPKGFYGEPVEEPVVIGWMPAISLYFTDPDGHLLEYLAMLPQQPCPEAGVIPYGEWKAMQQSQQA
ncbi:VOC family protein [Scytonema sp. UIC 10036]|uniref:VOC family protein n=1 Tax=Scytonema sp. UIC 10036 TaxID=2304196 RepID=UPI0012DA5975|nr:VOC family protein [Scytonema sp. UIC 10036]MUG91139.1 VOC family protein [Scytonema sp. UIC 10036]